MWFCIPFLLVLSYFDIFASHFSFDAPLFVKGLLIGVQYPNECIVHCGTNNRVPRWTFTNPCKPEVRPGAREESASPAWLAASAMNARDTTKVYIWRLDTGCGPTNLQISKYMLFLKLNRLIYGL